MNMYPSVCVCVCVCDGAGTCRRDSRRTCTVYVARPPLPQAMLGRPQAHRLLRLLSASRALLEAELKWSQATISSLKEPSSDVINPSGLLPAGLLTRSTSGQPFSFRHPPSPDQVHKSRICPSDNLNRPVFSLFYLLSSAVARPPSQVFASVQSTPRSHQSAARTATGWRGER